MGLNKKNKKVTVIKGDHLGSVVEAHQQQKVCTILIVMTVIYLDVKLATITCSPTISLIVISYNNHLAEALQQQRYVFTHR